MALVRIGGVVVLAAGVAKASAKGGAESSAKGSDRRGAGVELCPKRTWRNRLRAKHDSEGFRECREAGGGLSSCKG